MGPHLENIAIVGAGGQVGSFITAALIKLGKHKVSAITRVGSMSSRIMPTGLAAIHEVDYGDHESLVLALTGQDVLISTVPVSSNSHDIQTPLIDAACAAGVKFIIPNEYGVDMDPESLGNDIGLREPRLATRRYVEEKGQGRTSWIAVCCGSWFEYCLAGGDPYFGFDIPGKKVTLFNDGNTKISATTWPQLGLAVATLLALPEKSADGNPSMQSWRNRTFFVASFLVSQHDMLSSILRVTGDQTTEWTITTEEVHERYERGQQLLERGEAGLGFVLRLFSRIFFPEDPADHEARCRDQPFNALPNEQDMDEATRTAIEMATQADPGFSSQVSWPESKPLY